VKNPLGINLTPMAEGAAATHELFMAYVQAGFTREEALQLVISMITASAPRTEK
jgi:hypothetical protein